MAGPAPLKVLQVGSSLFDWGGIERYVLYLTSGLTQRGHEVSVTCPVGSPLAKRLLTSIPIQTKRKSDMRSMRQYLKLFRSHRFDVVHTHFNPDFLVAGIAARLTGQPCSILTRHVALPWSAGKVKLYGSIFDHIIPVSNAVEKQLSASGISPGKMTVAKAGCPALEPSLTGEEARAKLGVDESRFSIGSFGRLSHEKGLDLIFQAAMMSRAEGVQFHVFGNGPLLSEFQALGKTSGVLVHGFREDVADCMNAMDAIIIPSRWEEAFPYAALEAMSLAKPLLVSKVGGLLEIVQEGSTGLAFEKDRADEVGAACAKLATEPLTAAAMGAKAQEIHRSSYTVEAMAERIEAVYLSVISR